MPEGDTVWLTAKRLDGALRGRAVTRSDMRVPQLAALDLRGRTVTEVVPRGKHILTRLDDATTLHSHLRMDGSYDITPARHRSHRYPDHLIRVLLTNDSWQTTGYRIHDLRLLKTRDESLVVGHLGPDLLGADWDPQEAVRRLREGPDVPIGEALLDQHNLAGIGNLYKSEVLFLCGIHPAARVGQVGDLAGLVTHAQRLMFANRDHPEQSTTGLIKRGRRTWVYERGGRPCLRCRSLVMRDASGPAGRERSNYWCPVCQPEPG